MSKNKKKIINHTYIGVLKGLISSLVVCILAILIYSVILKSFSMGDETIPIFNQIIKIVGIIITSYYSVKDSKNIYMGMLGGMSFILVTYLVFSLINTSFGAVSILGSDLAMGAVIGCIFGLIISKMIIKDEKKR